MPYSEHPFMDRVESPEPHPPVHGPSVHAQAFELRERNQAMLTRGDPSNLPIPPPAASGPTGRNVHQAWTFRPVGGHPWERAGVGRAGGAQRMTIASRQSCVGVTQGSP